MGSLLGDRVREIMTSKGISGRKLEQLAPLSKGYSSRILKGQRLNIGIDKVLGIARALGVDPKAIYEEAAPVLHPTRNAELDKVLEFAAGWLPAAFLEEYSRTVEHRGLKDLHRRTYLADLESMFEQWKITKPPGRTAPTRPSRCPAASSWSEDMHSLAKRKSGGLYPGQ